MLKTWQLENNLISFFAVVIIGTSFHGANGEFNEVDVYKEIIANYDKNVRPSQNIRKATVVSVNLNYFVLLSMDQKQETITFMTELEMIWNDEFVKWNSSAFDDITSVTIPSSLLWKPDIIVQTSLNIDCMVPEDQRVVNVLSNGTVRSSSPCIITNQCLLSIKYFPFDDQTCSVTLGSWMYPSSQIDLDLGQKKNNTCDYCYKGNGEWTLLSPGLEPSLNHFTESDGTNWAEITYTIQLKRQPIYYTCVLLFPTFVTATICLFGLFLPSTNTGERIEKVNMGLTTLLNIAVILGIVAGEMPKTTILPLLGFYVLAEFFLCAVGVGVSMLIMLAHQRIGTRSLLPPRWLSAMVLCTINSKLSKPEKTNVTVAAYSGKITLPLSKDQETSAQIETTMNSIYTKRLNQVLDSIEGYINDKKFEDCLLLEWIKIFDRIDIFFLILFNVVNVVMSYILLFD